MNLNANMLCLILKKIPGEHLGLRANCLAICIEVVDVYEAFLKCVHASQNDHKIVKRRKLEQG